jgi:hypothetical protein
MTYTKHQTAKSVLATLTMSAFATTAFSQISAPTSSYSGDMVLTSEVSAPVNLKVFAVPHNRRIEAETQSGVMVTLINTQAREAFTYGKDANGPMGIQAMKIAFTDSVEAMAADLSKMPAPVMLGRDIVAGHSCTNYQTDEGVSCVTYDGILMRATGTDGAVVEMTSLERAAQPPYLFKVPNGYVINDATEMAEMGGDGTGTVQAFMQKQAHKQTKKQVKKMAKKQIGNNIGGAIGGGFVGGTIGNEAGKLASGLVGGLFGKKKEKKKEDKTKKTDKK